MHTMWNRKLLPKQPCPRNPQLWSVPLRIIITYLMEHGLAKTAQRGFHRAKCCAICMSECSKFPYLAVLLGCKQLLPNLASVVSASLGPSIPGNLMSGWPYPYQTCIPSFTSEDVGAIAWMRRLVRCNSLSVAHWACSLAAVMCECSCVGGSHLLCLHFDGAF